MRFAYVLIFTSLFFATSIVLAKTSADVDCPDCGVRKSLRPMETKSIENFLDHMGAVPAALPQNKKVAALYGKDDRVLAGPGYPFNSIGRILRAGMSPCTATRVSACHVLTASHCVQLPSGKVHPKMAFQPPFEPKAYMVKKGVVLAGEIDIENDKLNQDWAIALLEESDSGIRDGWLGIKDKKGTELVGKKFFLTGMQQDLSPTGKDLFTDPGVEVIRTDKGTFFGDPNYFFFRGDTAPGSSGGPVYETDSEGKAWIVGINSSESSVEGGSVRYSDRETADLNRAVATNQFFAKIQKFMAENPCPAPKAGMENTRTP